MQPYFDAAEDLLAKYPTNEFNLEKAAALMEGQGYEKDGEGFWVKDGERIPRLISGWQVFNDIGPLIAEQLRKGGFEAEWTTPADTRHAHQRWHRRRSGSTATAARLPIRSRPWTMYTSKYWAPIGEPTAYNSRFKNAEYDELLARDGHHEAGSGRSGLHGPLSGGHGDLAGEPGRCARFSSGCIAFP